MTRARWGAQLKLKHYNMKLTERESKHDTSKMGGIAKAKTLQQETN